MVGNVRSPGSKRMRSSASRSTVSKPTSTPVSPGSKGVRNQNRKRMSSGASVNSARSAAKDGGAHDKDTGNHVSAHGVGSTVRGILLEVERTARAQVQAQGSDGYSKARTAHARQSGGNDNEPAFTIIRPDAAATQWIKNNPEVREAVNNLNAQIFSDILVGNSQTVLNVTGPRQDSVARLATDIAMFSGIPVQLTLYDGESTMEGIDGVAMDSSDDFTSFDNETLVSLGDKGTDAEAKMDAPTEEDEHRSNETMVKWLHSSGSVFSSGLQILAPNWIHHKPGKPVQAAFSLKLYDSANYAMDRGHIIMRIDQKGGHSFLAHSTSHPEDHGSMQYAYASTRTISAQVATSATLAGSYGSSESTTVTKPVRTMCQSIGTDFTEHGAGFLILPVDVHGGRSEKICFELNITPRSVKTIQPIEFTATSYLRLRPVWKRNAKSKDEHVEAIILVHSIHTDDIYTFESTRDSYHVILDNDLSGYGPLVRECRLHSLSVPNTPSSTRTRVGAERLTSPAVRTVQKFLKMTKEFMMGKNEIEKNKRKVIKLALRQNISLIEMSASDGQLTTSNIEREALEVPYAELIKDRSKI
ncbi:hypothetical protein BT96DRAFT_922134 [Gymnopus androsaceus JB14]|uniref:Uncharacterized protein n=1 Tax=Gymnopus androsaceus JB14 TaxID=1447944 RepID=A0A6A4HF31_9AGAR|nr:hypothetical protein BT96DRAFT_922134 [Gymnopus androsaceus JB14]